MVQTVSPRVCDVFFYIFCVPDRLTPERFVRSMKCADNKEEWSYDRGEAKCTFGAHGVFKFIWDGADLKCSTDGVEAPSCVFDGNAVHFIFPVLIASGC